MRMLMETKLDETEWVQTRLDQLNIINEKRMIALFHGQLYKKILKRNSTKRYVLENSGKSI